MAKGSFKRQKESKNSSIIIDGIVKFESTRFMTFFFFSLEDSIKEIF